MNPADWDRTGELFADLLDSDAGRRATVLAAEDQAVRIEVERLLAEHERGSGLLDRRLFSGIVEQDLWTGQILKDRYRIERFLARGGAGAVYLARDEHLAGRAVVVKFLHAWARQYVWMKSRVRQEMEALARIEHHGVVGVLDTGETADGLPYLVIEFVDGVTLRSEIARGPLEIARVSRLIRGIGRAVAAAHAQGVLHRDLKPENIMLEHPGTPEETVRLIDFGIARLDEPGADTVSRTTQFAGTTAYMSPEQLQGKPGRASDIYAMGLIAYEMLTGSRPFSAANPIQLHEQQRAGVKGDPRRLRAGIPEPAVKAILKELSFRAEDRSASALRAGEQIADALTGPMREPWSRRRATAVVVTTTAGAAAAAYAWRKSETRPLNPRERSIEFEIGTEPLERGFTTFLSIDYHVLMNPDATGFDSVRISTSDQGGYYHPLTAAQARTARRNGWKLTMEGAVEEGVVSCTVDNPLDPRRYSVGLFRNNRADSIFGLLLAGPVTKFIEEPLTGPAGARHQLVMIYAPQTGLAEVWADGVKRISGYAGSPDFRYSRGLQVSAARFRSQRSSGILWKARLEIA